MKHLAPNMASRNVPFAITGPSAVLHRKAHRQEGTVGGYPLRKDYGYEPVLS
jgi:hypothetical protein